MQQTIEPTLEAAAKTASDVETLSKRLIHLLSFVPDDKLTWTPSGTAKSCLRITAHCALVNQFFGNAISGKSPASMPSPEEFFKGLYEAEEKITSRQSVITILTESAAELCDAIRALNAEKMNSEPNSPFGPLPMQFWLDQSAEHLAKHIGQVEYLQTIWGDLDNHFR
jgi:hypothetical protein